MAETRERILRVACFIAALAAMVYGYNILIFTHMPMLFVDKLEDLSYGWYVPIFSLYVLWREREAIVRSVGAASVWGLIVLLPMLFVGFIGVRGCQVRFELLGFVGALLSLVWIMFGARTAKQTAFPILFLLFCTPLHTFLDVVTVHMRIFAVSVAYGILKGLGVDIVREGTMLMGTAGNSFAIDVASPCSGMRSLFAMMALTAGYAYFNQPTWLRRGLLFALSIPIAILGNIVRIGSIVLIAATCSSDFATGFYHDYSGYVVFFVAIAAMLATGGLITKGAELCARR